MKLFTSQIDNKLFKQYPMGSNLDKQVVVCKIFNPYGNGRWYILNSDPSDPDYLWAIVQMGDVVEMGSVSRSELEKIKVSRFNFPLERDLSFSPLMANEVYEGLLEGKHFKHGGWIEYEKGGAFDLNKALTKYARQDVNLLEKEGHLFVTDTKHGNLDCTHKNGVYKLGDKFEGTKAEAIEYLKNCYQVEDEGTMAHGGETAKTFIVEYELNGKKHKTSYLLYPNDRVEKLLPPSAKIISIKEKMAHGGYMADGGMTENLKVGDIVVEYKKPNPNQSKREMGGQGKIISISNAMAKVEYENNYEEWIPLKDLKVVAESKMAHGGYMADGGMVEHKRIKLKKFDIIVSLTNLKGVNGSYNSPSYIGIPKGTSFKVFNSTTRFGDLFCYLMKGEVVEYARTKPNEPPFGGETIKILKHKIDLKDFFKYYNLGKNSDTYHLFEVGLREGYYSEIDGYGYVDSAKWGVYRDNGKAEFLPVKMAEGGELNWGKDLGGGFTIGTDVYITDSKSMFKGKTGFVSGLAGKDLLVTISEDGNDRSVVVSKKGVEKLDAPEMAMGGETTFADKVSAIKKSLLNKKVPSKYKKDYGNTYGTKDSQRAAERIAGAMVAKENK